MQKDVILTPEGLEKLKQEIEYLSNDKRREVAERIKEAREFGDISENSEYDDAKNEQMMLEARIAALEEKLRSASVIDASELDSDVVRVGVNVHVKDEGSGKSTQYTIVGSTEADSGAVDLGTRVTLKLVGSRGKNDERTFQIVGANESDPASGKLSHASPVGRAVLKRRVGDKVTVSTPRGATEYEIVNVEVAS